MPNSTPGRAIPYALDADSRASWPGLSKAVAERLEVVLNDAAASDAAALAALDGRAAALEGKTDLTDVFVGAVWGAGWALSAMSATAIGHLVFIRGTATRSGGAISVGTAGNIPDETIVTMDLGGRTPANRTGLMSAGGRRGVFLRATASSGQVHVQMVAVTGSADIDTNDVVEFTGMFLSAVPG